MQFKVGIILAVLDLECRVHWMILMSLEPLDQDHMERARKLGGKKMER